MTDTVTETPTVQVGQAWRRKTGTYRVLVLAVVDLEGHQYVLHRSTLGVQGDWPSVDSLADFRAVFTDPTWPPPDAVTGYAPVYVTDGVRWTPRLLRDDPEDVSLVEAVAKGAIGVVRVTTTYEWVRAGELEGGE